MIIKERIKREVLANPNYALNHTCTGFEPN